MNRFLIAFLLLLAVESNAQIIGRTNDDDLRTITTAVPFLLITPDTRAGGMGDAGVATSPDANSLHWNMSKLAFAEKDSELSLSYSPWLNKITNDMSLAYLSAYKKFADNQAGAVSLRYFDLGSIQFTDEGARIIKDYRPKEFALDVGYAIQLSDKISGGMAARYVFSNLTGGISANQGLEARSGNSFAVDVNAYYQNDDIKLGDYDGILAVGMNISNIGSKMAYTTSGQRDFIPTNLRLGPALSIFMDQYNKLTFTAEANKLLVPSTPIYSDSTTTGILAGRDPNVGVASGIFGSFSDAPGVIEVNQNGDVTTESGSVFREEMREINLASGVEYWYQDQFALRGGFFYEHPTKGGRKYATVGFGLRFNVLAFDASYLIPTEQNNPLANTLRFTLRLFFDQVGGGSGEGQDSKGE